MTFFSVEKLLDPARGELRVACLIACLILPGCSGLSTRGGSSEEQARWKAACSEGYALACYVQGKELAGEKLWGEASIFLAKACDLNMAHACSDLGYARNQIESGGKEALKYAKRACDLGDGIGCYNAACYECKYRKNPKAAMAHLQQAYQLGVNEFARIEADPDLNCVRKLRDYRPLGESMSRRLDATLSSPRHQFVEHLGVSLIPPAGFQVTGGNPLVFSDTSGAVFGALSSTFPIQRSIERVKNAGAGQKVLVEKEFTRNGFPYYLRVFNKQIQGQKRIFFEALTGNQDQTTEISGSCPEMAEPMLHEVLMQFLGSMIFRPWGLYGFRQSKGIIGIRDSGLRPFARSGATWFYNLTGQRAEASGPESWNSNAIAVSLVLLKSPQEVSLEGVLSQLAQTQGGKVKSGSLRKGTVRSADDSLAGETDSGWRISVHRMDTGESVQGMKVYVAAVVSLDPKGKDVSKLQRAVERALPALTPAPAFLRKLKEGGLLIPEEKAPIGTGRGGVG